METWSIRMSSSAVFLSGPLVAFGTERLFLCYKGNDVPRAVRGSTAICAV